MNVMKILCGGLLCLAILTTAAVADPEYQEARPTLSNPSTLQGPGNEAITRSEFVGEIESVLTRWESQTEMYATKSELAELRTMLVELRKEFRVDAGAENESTTQLDSLEQRVQNLNRPGF